MGIGNWGAPGMVMPGDEGVDKAQSFGDIFHYHFASLTNAECVFGKAWSVIPYGNWELRSLLGAPPMTTLPTLAFEPATF